MSYVGMTYVYVQCVHGTGTHIRYLPHNLKLNHIKQFRTSTTCTVTETPRAHTRPDNGDQPTTTVHRLGMSTTRHVGRATEERERGRARAPSYSATLLQ